MNKREVAERLGVSIRRVEQFDAEERLGTKSYVKGKTGNQANWSEESVEQLKRELETPVMPVSALQGTNSSSAGLVRRADTAAFFEQLAAMMERRDIQPQLNIGEKLMLTLADAAALTSLSTNHLRDAIKAGKIKARIIGRGWKIKRADLDAYVRKL
jgi:excisionase family DNA binding protein